MLQYGEKELAYKLTRNLAEQILTIGHRGSMSENLDAFPDMNGNLVTTGTYAQAWSVSEFHRNGYQDYVGFRPDMLKGKVSLIPQFPASWREAYVTLPFGSEDTLSVSFNREGHKEVYHLSCDAGVIELAFGFDTDAGNRQHYSLKLENAMVLRVDSESGLLEVDGVTVKPDSTVSNHKDIIGQLRFNHPAVDRRYPVLSGTGLLEREILSQQYAENED